MKTIKQLVDIAQRPDRATVEQLREAVRYWEAQADASPFGQGGDARVRYQLCTDELRAREVTR